MLLVLVELREQSSSCKWKSRGSRKGKAFGDEKEEEIEDEGMEVVAEYSREVGEKVMSSLCSSFLILGFL